MKIYTYRSAHSRSAKNFKRVLSVALSLLVVLQMTPGAFAVNYASANHGGPYGDTPQSNVTICHRTGNGGYISNSPSVSSADGSPNGHGAGHELDIIPPYHWLDNQNVSHSYPGQNWTAQNEDIWTGNGPTDRCSGDGIIPPPVVLGCTDANANNYNPNATQNDGSCTYTGTLIVQKVVINDNGGTTATSSFSFKVNGGSSVNFESDGENSLTVATGTYTVVEDTASGYSTSYNNCTSVTVLPNQTTTCVITNNDIAPNAPVINVAIDKTVNDSTPDEGQQIVFTMVVSNSGPDAATNVVANDAIGSDFTFVSASSTAGTYASSTGNWTIGSLANGSSATLEITVTVNSGTAGLTITNIATVNATETDSDSSNNTDSASVVVNTPETPTDLCLNIPEIQTQIPEGMTRDENGNCNRPSEPTDVCANIDGVQTEVPEGMELQDNNQCVTPDDTTTTSGGGSHRSSNRTLVTNDSTPQGQVLGATFEPGLPNTGNGPIDTQNNVFQTLFVVLAGLITLAGLNLISFKLLSEEGGRV